MLLRSFLTAGTVVLLGVMLGCGRGGAGSSDPVTPDAGTRLGRDFRPPWNIFGMNQEDDPGNADFHHQVANEVDLAPLVWGHNFAEDAGDLVMDGDGNSFVAAVSRIDEMLLGQPVSSVIELKFFAMRQHPSTQETEPVMYDMEGGEFWGSEISPVYQFNTIPGHIVCQPGETDCQNPRVIACADHWDYGDLIIHVQVAYEVLPSPITISVYRGVFKIDFTPPGPEDILIEPEAYPLWATVASDTNGDCLFPDLEIGPTSGCTHLVYTHYEPAQPRDARIHYRARLYGEAQFSGYAWLNEWDGGDNGWIPRIDVGTVTDPYHFQTHGDVMTVAVVYTRQEVDPGQTFYGYRSYVRYWREVDGPGDPRTSPNSRQLAVVNGQWEPPQVSGYHGSGLPVIEIEPESNDEHDAYVAFVQQVSTLPDFIRHAVYVVGHAFQGEQLIVQFIAVTGLQDETAVLPTMCMHYGIRQLSITYYHQCTVGLGPWTVIARRIEYLGDMILHLQTVIDTEAYGNFNIAELANYNFGVASGLAATVTESNPSYFASWSDAVGIVCEPCHIQATFGYTYYPY